VYRIRTPAAGRWFYLVVVNKPSAEFFAAASALTSLTAQVGPRQLARRPADYLMPIRVWIADRGSVLGAFVGGYVRDPNGVKVPLALFDDGLHHDGVANDGIYGFGFPAIVPGAYYVDLVAAGTSSTGVGFTRYLWTSFVIPGARRRPGEFPPVPPRRRCNCEDEARYSVAWYGGLTFPHGALDGVADSSTSVGIKPAYHFGLAGARASLGLYLGQDNFSNASGGTDFNVKHLSPEFEIWPWTRLCPQPSLHVGTGWYRDEAGNDAWGFNVGGGLKYCLTDRLSLLGRYDYRRANGLSRDYSTVQIGLRWRF
jgi:hypothetical protein